jgi:hypothetical protein
MDGREIPQLPRINVVTLAADFQQRVLPRITYQHFADARPQQVVQPSCPSPFFLGTYPALIVRGSGTLDSRPEDLASPSIPVSGNQLKEVL